MASPDSFPSAGTVAVFAGLGCLGKACAVVAATATGVCCFVVGRHAVRVTRARRQLRALLDGAAGEEARVVITGATSGIGLELTNQCLRHPAMKLLLGCRNMKLAASRWPEGERLRVVQLELLDLDSVQNFADEAHHFLKTGRPGLRLLVNNAGVMRVPATEKRKSRCDPVWQTNFLGPFLLTELLARRRAADRAALAMPLRVVQVSSRTERGSQLSEDMLEQVSKGVVGEGKRPYGDSKRALMLWTSVRAQHFAFKAAARVHCATPGLVDTQLGRFYPMWSLLKPVRMLMMRPPAEGALKIAAAGLCPGALASFGKYMDGGEELEDLPLQRISDKPLANRLVKWAAEATLLEQRADGYDR